MATYRDDRDRYTDRWMDGWMGTAAVALAKISGVSLCGGHLKC